MKKTTVSAGLIVIAMMFALLLGSCDPDKNKDKDEGGDEGKTPFELGATGPTSALTDPSAPSGGWKTSGNMLELEPMRNQFKDYFPLFGNIATNSDYSGGKITNQRLLHHYNVLTAENNMKPDKYNSSLSGTTVTIGSWTTADNFVDAARASGFAVVGHALLWHSQNATWMSGVGSKSEADAKAIMESWITQVVTHYKGKIYSWDVLNELFPDSGLGSSWKTSMRDNNPWAKAIKSDFVYYGFLAARNADPDAILYYNDYNMDNTAKSNLVRDMVKDVNDKYKKEYPDADRLLIEGIGMQSHHNTGVNANNIKAALDKFKPLGVRISISELDVLSGGYSGSLATKGSVHSSVTDSTRQQAAQKYYDYFKVFLEYNDMIERVTFWGVYDEQSWRSAGAPLIFAGSTNTVSKPAYEKVIQALSEKN